MCDQIPAGRPHFAGLIRSLLPGRPAGTNRKLEIGVVMVPREPPRQPVNGAHAQRIYDPADVKGMDENSQKMHEVLKDRIFKKYIESPPDQNSNIAMVADPMIDLEEVFGEESPRIDAARAAFREDVQKRQAHLRAQGHNKYKMHAFMPGAASTEVTVSSPPPAKKANFGQMLAAQHSPVQKEEEWEIYYRMCTDILFLGKANVGGAVNEAGEPLDAKNPPRFCLFKWISVIEQDCPAVALTMRAAFSAQATSTASERTFSQAGLASGGQRSDLKPHVLSRLIYLRMNQEWLQSLEAVADAYMKKHPGRAGAGVGDNGARD